MNIDHRPHFPHDWWRAADEGDVEKTNSNRGTFPLPSSLRKQMAIEEGPPQLQ